MQSILLLVQWKCVIDSGKSGSDFNLLQQHRHFIIFGGKFGNLVKILQLQYRVSKCAGKISGNDDR
jgi:hypothetical protein